MFLICKIFPCGYKSSIWPQHRKTIRDPNKLGLWKYSQCSGTNCWWTHSYIESVPCQVVFVNSMCPLWGHWLPNPAPRHYHRRRRGVVRLRQRCQQQHRWRRGRLGCVYDLPSLCCSFYCPCLHCNLLVFGCGALDVWRCNCQHFQMNCWGVFRDQPCHCKRKNLHLLFVSP